MIPELERVTRLACSNFTVTNTKLENGELVDNHMFTMSAWPAVPRDAGGTLYSRSNKLVPKFFDFLEPPVVGGGLSQGRLWRGFVGVTGPFLKGFSGGFLNPLGEGLLQGRF